MLPQRPAGLKLFDVDLDRPVLRRCEIREHLLKTRLVKKKTAVQQILGNPSLSAERGWVAVWSGAGSRGNGDRWRAGNVSHHPAAAKDAQFWNPYGSADNDVSDFIEKVDQAPETFSALCSDHLQRLDPLAFFRLDHPCRRVTIGLARRA